MGGHEEEPPAVGRVRVFSIAGRMASQRERLMGMTNEERRWRAQYLKDQALAPNEPRFSPEYYKATQNIFIRLYRVPMDLFQKAITPIAGEKRAPTIRYVTGRLITFYFGACLLTYYFKFHKQDWTTTSGWYAISARDPQFPGNPGYPTILKKEKHEYGDIGFSKSHFA